MRALDDELTIPQLILAKQMLENANIFTDQKLMIRTTLSGKITVDLVAVDWSRKILDNMNLNEAYTFKQSAEKRGHNQILLGLSGQGQHFREEGLNTSAGVQDLMPVLWPPGWRSGMPKGLPDRTWERFWRDKGSSGKSSASTGSASSGVDLCALPSRKMTRVCSHRQAQSQDF